jgi:hypothetical protein
MSPDSRNRMISFRLSPEEYEKFRELCFSSGIRSLSEMARVAINNFLTHQTPKSATQNSLDARISDLENRLQILSNELKRQRGSINNNPRNTAQVSAAE